MTTRLEQCLQYLKDENIEIIHSGQNYITFIYENKKCAIADNSTEFYQKFRLIMHIPFQIEAFRYYKILEIVNSINSLRDIKAVLDTDNNELCLDCYLSTDEDVYSMLDIYMFDSLNKMLDVEKLFREEMHKLDTIYEIRNKISRENLLSIIKDSSLNK